MALPILYWLLECTECGARRVVHDTYLLFVGTTDPHPMEGAGYSGPPLPERYKCKKECSAATMRVIGSLHAPQDHTMWLHEPHKKVKLTLRQIIEWRWLIWEADLKKFFRSA
jgi:hypothetical protein